VKQKLARAMNTAMDPLRERRAAVLARPGYVRDLLFEGSARARVVATETMARVRDAVHLKY
jgi:tryptophanyl-tRNA synthetase